MSGEAKATEQEAKDKAAQDAQAAEASKAKAAEDKATASKAKAQEKALADAQAYSAELEKENKGLEQKTKDLGAKLAKAETEAESLREQLAEATAKGKAGSKAPPAALLAADYARAPKLVRMVVTDGGGLLRDGVVMGPGHEFEAEERHVQGFLEQGGFKVIDR